MVSWVCFVILALEWRKRGKEGSLFFIIEFSHNNPKYYLVKRFWVSLIILVIVALIFVAFF